MMRLLEQESWGSPSIQRLASGLTLCRKLIAATHVVAIALVLAMVVSWPGAVEASANVEVLQPRDALPGTRRLALVIGNSAYKNVPFLKNPANDAKAVAERLQGLGYEVRLAKDLDRLSFNETVAAFLQAIEPGTESLVYYAGHGVELGGSNYLLPVDVPALSAEQEYLLRTEGINLTDLLIELQARSAQVTLVILDACRDNPFQVAGAPAGTRSLGTSRGLGRVDPPRGTFVIFSAGVGEQALDNLGPSDTSPNGLFTRKLLTLMGQQGLEIRSMVQQLRVQVRQAALSGAGQSQTPSYYDQLLGEFYFWPNEAKPSPSQPSSNVTPNQSVTLPLQPPRMDSVGALPGRIFEIHVRTHTGKSSEPVSTWLGWKEVLTISVYDYTIITQYISVKSDSSDPDFVPGRETEYALAYPINSSKDPRQMQENMHLYNDEEMKFSNIYVKSAIEDNFLTLEYVDNHVYDLGLNDESWEYYVNNGDTSKIISIYFGANDCRLVRYENKNNEHVKSKLRKNSKSKENDKYTMLTNLDDSSCQVVSPEISAK